MIRVTSDIEIQENEIQESFIRASGPGGQNVNKVSTAVQIRFDVVHSPSLPEDVRARLIRLSGKRITEDGVLIIDEDLVNADTKKKILSIPSTRIAEEVGHRIFANVVMLGYVTQVTGVVSVEAMRKAIPESVPERFVEKNLAAFERGFEYKQQEAG